LKPRNEAEAIGSSFFLSFLLAAPPSLPPFSRLPILRPWRPDRGAAASRRATRKRISPPPLPLPPLPSPFSPFLFTLNVLSSKRYTRAPRQRARASGTAAAAPVDACFPPFLPSPYLLHYRSLVFRKSCGDGGTRPYRKGSPFRLSVFLCRGGVRTPKILLGQYREGKAACGLERLSSPPPSLFLLFSYLSPPPPSEGPIRLHSPHQAQQLEGIKTN